MKKRVGVLGSVLLVGGLAAAHDETLKGTFRVTSFRGCLQAKQIVDGIPVPPESADTRTSSSLKVYQYNGYGTGMVEIETLNIREGGVGKSRTFCDIEMVVVNDDGSFTQDLVNCRGTVEEGRNTGLDFVITPTSEQGQITSNEKVLILSTVGLNVFTLTFTRPDGSTFSRERICGLSGTGLEVEDDDDDDDEDDDDDDDEGRRGRRGRRR